MELTQKVFEIPMESMYFQSNVSTCLPNPGHWLQFQNPIPQMIITAAERRLSCLDSSGQLIQ
jgi:hypothetical protein